MLRLGPPYYEFEGVSVMGDAQDPLQFYYFPNKPTIPIDDQGRPAIRFIILKEAQDELDGLTPGTPGTEEDVAGFLFFDTVLSWPKAVLDKVRDGLKEQIEEETGEEVEVRIAPLPYLRGGVQLSFLDETTRPVVLEPPPPVPGEPVVVTPPVVDMKAAWVPFLTTSGTPSLYGENRAVFQAQLNRKATKLLFGAFSGMIPASVYYELQFPGQLQAYNVTVSADWSAVNTFVQDKFEGNFLFVRAEVDDIVTTLEEAQVIKIESTLDATDPSFDARQMEEEVKNVRKDLQELVLETFFKPATSPTVEGDGQSDFDEGVDSLTRLHNMTRPFPSVGYTKRSVSTSELRSINVDYTVNRAVLRTIAPQAHIHVFFEDLGVTREDIVTVVDGSDDFWKTTDFTAQVVADFEGDGIDTIAMDVQYTKSFSAAPDLLANPNAQWSFTFSGPDDVVRKRAWFDPEIGTAFFWRYRVFFKPGALPGPSQMLESPWRVEQSQTIIASTAELFERETVTIETVKTFPWARYPQVFVRLRYDDPVSSWLHEDSKLLDADHRSMVSKFRQRAKDGINAEYQVHYIRSDNAVIETAWAPVTGALTVIHNPDPPQLEVQFVVSPATRLGLLILNLRYVDEANGVFEDMTLMFNATNGLVPQSWKVPWKDPSKRRYFMQQTIIDADNNVTDTGMVEAEGRTQVLGDVFARKLEVQPKLIGPGFAVQNLEKIILRLKYEDAGNGVLSETIHEFMAPGDAPTWTVMLKDAGRREYSYALTYVLNTGFAPSTGFVTGRDRFLVLSSQVPT